MPLGYVPDFRKKVLANLNGCDEDKLSLVEDTMSSFLDLYLKEHTIIQSNYQQIVEQFKITSRLMRRL